MITWPLVGLHLKGIIPFSFSSGVDSSGTMKHSTLFQSRPWSKDLPFWPPKEGIYSHPESTTSDAEDTALKGMSHLHTILI